MYAISLPSFSGPLDLLLRLIERAELDITTIALASVADQYLAHVRALDEVDPQQLAEFVAVAARLLLIKSRALLPSPPAEVRAGALADDDDAATLARQLREYQRYKQLAGVLRSWQEEERRSYLRSAPPPLPEPAIVASALPHTVDDLIAAVQRRLQLRLPRDPGTALALPPRLTVGAVARRIRERLGSARWFSFDDLLDTAASRQEVIVTFWAVLELLKRRVIRVEQEDLFGTIAITRGESATPDDMDEEPTLL